MELVKGNGMKAPSELTITIAGESGSGKSNLAVHLSQLMFAMGFNVEFYDDTKEVVIYELGKPSSINTIKERTLIRVTTQQLPR